MASDSRPTTATGNRLMAWLALVLPLEFVRRVAQPAWEDEQLEWVQRGAIPTLARTRFVLNCLWVGVPLIFWRRGRPTRVTLVAMGSALLLLAAVMLLAPKLYQLYPGPR